MTSERVRAVVQTGPGILELNYSWLPTWIGMNAALKKEIDAALASQLVGETLDEIGLDYAHRLVVDFLVQRFPNIVNLHLYLDELRSVSLK